MKNFTFNINTFFRFLPFSLYTLIAICSIGKVWGQRYYKQPHSDLEYGKKLVYQIDFRQKINAPFFSPGYEFSRIIVAAVKSANLKAYSSPFFDSLLTIESFNKKLKIPYLDDKSILDFDGEEIDSAKFKEKSKDDPIYYLSKELYLLEFEERYYFDRHYSQFRHKILTISLILPAEVNPFGIDKRIGTFKYEDVVDIFKNTPTKFWRNAQNDNQNFDIIEAFENRFFNARLIRYEEPKSNIMIDMYEGEKNLNLSEQIILKLIENELRHWRY